MKTYQLNKKVNTTQILIKTLMNMTVFIYD